MISGTSADAGFETKITASDGAASDFWSVSRTQWHDTGGWFF